ncbi:ReoY family proteolytic degradation factor [Bacillus horti]|uniref:Uncharacterized protein YpiB (UPF0302 family) n=1 Tax=Caldalkalibacillus horti TaxID=77523 RepID=A0ABT9VWW6_9BACI|nr:ReoY family proteolytic degradation factor [Bacillus horti]MDQ0165488.1 uncharacterized protein YpiB (UPF0302 family) [Bacillus horti]
MHQLVSVEAKRTFLDWFLNTFELQKKECAWLLTYLKSDDTLLEKVRFVDELIPNQKSIFMSTTCTSDISFKFNKKTFMTTDVERAFHDIRLHPEEYIYLKLTFKKAESSPEYAAVREVNPMEKYNTTSNSWYSLLAEMVLDEAIEKYQKEQLYQQIEMSLKQNDKESFLRLSKRWAKLNEGEA